MANTIFWSLLGERPISWGILLEDVLGKLVFGVEKGKPSLITPYFHLYGENKCLKEEYVVELKTAKTLLQFDVAPQVGEDPETTDADSEGDSPDLTEIQEMERRTSKSKRKSTYRVWDGVSPIWVPQWRNAMFSYFEFSDDPFKQIREKMD